MSTNNHSGTKAIFLVAILVCLAVAAFVFPIRDWIVSAISFIEANREIAWLIYIVSYIVATVLLIPGSIITLAAGFIFGLPAGFAVVSVGSVFGATCAFLVGRLFVREWVATKISGMPRFRALDHATNHSGLMIVFLARLSPLFPFNLLNYGLGLTAVRLRDFFFASWIGMMPGTILYVYIGTLAKDLAEISTGQIDSGQAGTALLVAGFVATVILTVLITRKATRVLNAELDAAASDEAPVDPAAIETKARI